MQNLIHYRYKDCADDSGIPVALLPSLTSFPRPLLPPRPPQNLISPSWCIPSSAAAGPSTGGRDVDISQNGAVYIYPPASANGTSYQPASGKREVDNGGYCRLQGMGCVCGGG